MGKKKDREAEYDASVVRALEELREAQQSARDTFRQEFDRLERKATTRMERIVERAREDADLATASLRAFLDEAQTTSGELVSQLETNVAHLDASCVEAQQDVDVLRTLRAASEGLAERVHTELESGRERIAVGTQEAEERLEALRAQVQAQLDTFTADAERRHSEIDAACQRIQGFAARAGKQSEQLERWTRHAEQAHAEVDARLGAVRADADAKLTIFQAHLDAALQAVNTAIGRVDADIAERVDTIAHRLEAAAALRVDECAARVGEEFDTRADGIVAQLEAQARERVGAATQRLDSEVASIGHRAADQLAALDAMRVAVEQQASAIDAARVAAEAASRDAREHAHGTRAVFDSVTELAEGSRRRVDEVDHETSTAAAALVDALRERTAEMEAAAGSRLDEVVHAFEERSASVLQAAIDDVLTLVEETRRERETVAPAPAPDQLDELDELDLEVPAAVAWVPLDADVADEDDVEVSNAHHVEDSERFDDSDGDDDRVHEDGVDDDGPADEGPAEAGAADGMWDVAPWARPPEVEGDTFFARIAAELRDSFDDGYPAAPQDTTAAFETSIPGADSPFGRVADAPRRSLDLLERVAVTAPVASLMGSLRQLETGETGQLVRLDIVKSEAPAGFASLRVSAFDPRGWWETHTLPLTCEVDADAWIAVDRVELLEALDDHSRFQSTSEARMVLHRDLEVGNHLLLAREGTAQATDPATGERVEHVDVRRLLLDDATSAGVALETQMGRMRVPAAFAASLRRRRVERADLVMVDGSACLRAPIVGTTADPIGIAIVCPLQDLGLDDVADAEERRTRGGEVAQLVVALSANTTADELAHLLKVGVGYARRRAASHPALAPELIDDLLRDGTDAMRAAAASNPSLSAESAEVASRDGAASVRAALAASSAITTELLEVLARDDAAQVRAGAASNPGAAASLLDELANDEEPAVRIAVASHPSTAGDTLAELARDADPAVGAAVARNASCPSDLLTELVGLAPESVLANPSVSKALLAAGTIVDLPHLRATVATNPTTSAKQLRILARDDEVEVLRAVAEHPGTPAAARRRALRRLERRLDDTF